ncbi:GNAT family N-acetyltransferase [Azotobacter salinestris]|uniref:GNAT family N-acetyltransferase n=1 Tax=Azotobacter salinestris TaxID=69964 RepID=UPI001266AF23|nr:GNAT family N-acetyltransferase [Azotobacter salinestris]
MEIRPATPADIPALCFLLDQLFAQEAEFTPDRAAQQRGLAAIIESPEVGGILLAEENGRPLGMVNLLYTVSTALGAPVALLEDMVVDAAARGRGLGTQLLEAAIATARQHGCLRITLLTDADNLDAQRFYARQGFARSPMIPLRRALDPA